jgi:hypothetical protein
VPLGRDALSEWTEEVNMGGVGHIEKNAHDSPRCLFPPVGYGIVNGE